MTKNVYAMRGFSQTHRSLAATEKQKIPNLTMKAATKDKALELPGGINKILNNFQLTSEELVKISQILKICRLKKRELFCEAGKVCDKIGILLDGLLMANFNTVKGTPNASRFFYSPDNIIVASFESFKTKRVSEESIIAIEDSILIYLTSDDLEELYSSVPSINKIARHFAEESYMAALRRIHDLQVLNNQ
ncbi:MAG: Crp/Fnr family transcriptional regulator, partial [Bacteroidetes bacterium]|nr:Crp/Fnr family transcriptional regulator [Bacteroidota bacterium]